MDEAEQLCDRLVIMDAGRIVAEGTPGELIDAYAAREVVELRLVDDAERAGAVALLERAGRVERAGERLLVYTDDADAVVRGIEAADLATASVLTRRGSLEDVFLIITGRSLEE
jgi:lipooligosaccharide transport system ATP-binding protein